MKEKHSRKKDRKREQERTPTQREKGSVGEKDRKSETERGKVRQKETDSEW